MRLFVALPIPQFVKKKLGDLKQPIEGTRWQQPSQIHLTLKFLGEVEADRLQDMKNNLGKIRTSPFSISIKGFGYFPQGKRPRVLWARIKKSEPLMKLQKVIEATCRELGFEAEDRTFKPHITIARMDGVSKRDIMSFVNQHKQFQIPKIPVKEFVLYESKLGSNGAKHIRLKTFPLVN